MPKPEWLAARRTKEVQNGEAALWSKCPKCGEVLYRRDLAANLYVCTRCAYHFRMSAYDRIESIADGEFAEIGNDVVSSDPLGWSDKKSYAAKLKSDRERSGLSESVVCGFAEIGGFPVAL
ncbi:MAG TPA: acetyl-CoA carboxylase carboxyl transferase subunit beta, partial [Candidatus Dormibacteraeota bacterium]|nr:acetyl-CoA carboxylase carboxyl transferase subunit beta [Candidatus Dormibacteraeota bacterium]